MTTGRSASSIACKLHLPANVSQQLQNIRAPHRGIVEAVTVRIAMRNVTSAAGSSLGACPTGLAERQAFVHELVKEGRAEVKRVEVVLEDIEPAVCNVVPADAQHVVRMYPAVRLHDEVAHSEVAKGIRSCPAPSDDGDEFVKDGDPNARIVLPEPLVKDGDEIVRHRGRSIAAIHA